MPNAKHNSDPVGPKEKLSSEGDLRVTNKDSAEQEDANWLYEILQEADNFARAVDGLPRRSIRRNRRKTS